MSGDYLKTLGNPNVELQQQFANLAREVLQHLRASTYDKDDLAQFLAFAAPRAPLAKGQLFQDLWALWESGGKSGGYFVEFGGASGVDLSNSYYLEKYCGWNGIVAEPLPRFEASIRANRNCYISTKCVFNKTGETVTFMDATSAELSRMVDVIPEDTHERNGTRRALSEFTVSTITLEDLLLEAGAPRDIDYLSIDTEGSELMILQAFDFSRWNVRSISVEHNGTRQREQLNALLTGCGFRRKWTEVSWFDDWYVKDRP